MWFIEMPFFRNNWNFESLLDKMLTKFVFKTGEQNCDSEIENKHLIKQVQKHKWMSPMYSTSLNRFSDNSTKERPVFSKEIFLNSEILEMGCLVR